MARHNFATSWSDLFIVLKFLARKPIHHEPAHHVQVLSNHFPGRRQQR
jgi:hypothetical protein